MTQQQMSGRTFTQEQVEWLIMIKDHITASLTIEMDDFDDVPFNQKGGVYRVYQVFREELNSIIGELNAVLAV
jgi:type I restriction enzyme R subunit